MAAETIVIDIVANFKNQTTSGMSNAKQSADRFTDSIKKSRNELDRLGRTNANPKVNLIDRASSKLSKIDSSLRAIGGKTFRAGVKILDYATTPLRMIKNSLFSIKGLVAAIGTGMVANQILAKPLSVADAYSSAKIGFSNLLGDTAGQKMMDDLDMFAKKTPFDTSGVIQNAQMMMAMGWNPKDILRDMETIGNAAAATGKGTMGLEAIVRALSQIKTKGKLSTEELNQLSEQGIAAKAMLAEQLGYGTGDSGIAKMSKDLEKGLIGSDTAIQALLQGMKQFDGMMDKTANETVEGLKAQIADAFEINIVRRWGQGLQDGAKRGLGSVLELLDKSEGTLEKFGDTVYDVGKELSNWAADKLEGTIDKILEISEREDFKNASIFGKGKILWDEIIAQPFSDWWDSKGKPFMAEKMSSVGEGIGSGLTKGLLALLGVDISAAAGDAVSIGGSFATGFAKGFESAKVWDAIVDAALRAFKLGFTKFFTGNAFERIISGYLGLKLASGILGGISKAQTLWSGTGALAGDGGLTLAGMGLKGMIGSTGNSMMQGTGLLNFLANVGYRATGGAASAGGYFGAGTAMSGGMAAFAGLGTVAGIAGGAAGLYNSIGDLVKATDAQTKNDKKLFGARSATKAGMVGTGALIGSLIAPGIGTAIGAGLGGVATFLAGNKLADAISGVSKTTEEMNTEFEELAAKNIEKRFGNITLSAEQLSKRVQEVFGLVNRDRINNFNNSLTSTEEAYNTVLGYADQLGYTHERIMAKEELSKDDVEEYKNSLKGYADAASQLLSVNKKSARSAFSLLYGDDKKGLQKMTKGLNSTYSKLEKELSDKSAKLNDVIADAFNDGKITVDEEKKINELVEQIASIQAKVEERLKKAESNASYDLLEMKYKDTDLTADSFKQLMSEIDKQSKADQEAYDTAYIKAKAEIDLQYEGKENTQAYKDALAEIQKKWRDGKAITVKQGVKVSFNVLEEHYGKEIEKFRKNLQERLNGSNLLSDKNLIDLKGSTTKTKTTVVDSRMGTTTSEKITSWGKEAEMEFKALQDSLLESLGADGALQKELAEYYESLKPQEEDLLELKKSYEEAGQKIPQWITDSLADIENIKLMSGDMDSFYKTIGEQIATEDKEYAETLIKEAGESLPKALKAGIEEGLKNTEINAKADVEVSANTKTENAEEKTKSETKDALGKEQTVNKTVIVPVDSVTTGAGTAADKAFNNLKSPLDQRFGTEISENGRVRVNSVSLSGAGEAISKAWNTFKRWAKDTFSVGVSVTSSVRVNQRMGTTDHSEDANDPKSANGRYVDRPLKTLVGEAGPEYIIPVSANRRQRGKYLWEQAGRALGLYPGIMQNANGGLYGYGSSKLGDMLNSAISVRNSEDKQTNNGKMTVSVNVGGITIQVASADEINDEDAMAGKIAKILEKAFQNIPVTVGT